MSSLLSSLSSQVSCLSPNFDHIEIIDTHTQPYQPPRLCSFVIRFALIHRNIVRSCLYFWPRPRPGPRPGPRIENAIATHLVSFAPFRFISIGVFQHGNVVGISSSFLTIRCNKQFRLIFILPLFNVS